MSVEAIYDTVMDDEKCLIKALKSLFGANNVKVNASGIDVKGFSSKHKPTIVIHLPGMFGTAGFYKDKNGSYKLVYDSSDRYKLHKLFPKKQGDITIDELQQQYSKAKVIDAINAMRGIIVGDVFDDNGVEKVKVRTN